MTEPDAEPECGCREPAFPATRGPDVSVLSGEPGTAAQADAEPEYFPDLNLDQLVRSVIAGREEYELRSLYYPRLASPAQASYRQAVFQDLDRPEVRGVVNSFAEDMREMRDWLSRASVVHHRLQKSQLFLTATLIYCRSVESLAAGLSATAPVSAGLRALRDYLTDYLASAVYGRLRADAHRIQDALAQIRYTVHIRGNRIVVNRQEEETEDYSDEVRAAFSNFAADNATATRARTEFPPLLEVDDVEAGILERVAALFPETFADLAQFFDDQQKFADPTVVKFDREVQFYLAYLDYLRPVRAAGLAFCYPRLTAQPQQTTVSDTFDLVLAVKLVAAGQPVICNDVELTGAEQILVVTGPNQAGKTTYARAFGQLHHLAALGCPVPGSSASLHLPDQIFTHFERAEDMTTGGGKLHNDLTRLRALLDHATSRSVIILNEIFTSTTLADAIDLSSMLAEQVVAVGCRCLWVTFLDEISRYSPQTVSVVALVSVNDPAVLTSGWSDGLLTAGPMLRRWPGSAGSAMSRFGQRSGHEGLPALCRERSERREAAAAAC